MNITGNEYSNWVNEIKRQIQSAQIKAALSASQEMIQLYWNIGQSIVEKQENQKWGSAVVEQLSKDLRKEFPDVSGLSRTNLFAMRQFYLFYKDKPEFVPQLVGQIPWGHTRLIISKIKNRQEAFYYSQQTIENNWSRDILAMQIESKLYEREGKAVTNFKKTLPKPHSDLANQTLKDPYMFDFMMLKKDAQEHEIEISLTKHITQFLLELGKGFAFIGTTRSNNKQEKLSNRFTFLSYQITVFCSDRTKSR